MSRRKTCEIKWHRVNVYFMLSYQCIVRDVMEVYVAIKYRIFIYSCLNNLLVLESAEKYL